MKKHLSNTIQVDFISDVVCPWCVVGYYQLAEAAKAAAIDLDIHWHPFELNPDMPAEGQNLREHIMEKYGSSEAESNAVRAKLIREGEKHGFTFNFSDDSRMRNTFKAHQLVHWADEVGKGHALKMAFFKAYFTDGLDVNDNKILTQIVNDIGLDGEGAAQTLADRRYEEDVRAAEANIHNQNITAVPTVIFNQRFGLSGARGVEAYKTVLLKIQSETVGTLN